MKKSVVLRLCVFFALSQILATPVLAAGGNPVFGISSTLSKVGDADGEPTYGGGFHHLIVNGVEAYTAYPYQNVYGEVEARVAYSVDGGNTWGRDSIVAHGDVADFGISIALGMGYVHLAWGEKQPDNIWVVKYAKGYRNQSGTWNWTVPVIVSGALNVWEHRISLATDGVGGVHIAYNEQNKDTYYVESTDNGETFRAPVLIGTANAEPSIAADDTGNVFIAWDDYNYSTGADEVYLSKRLVGQAWTTVKVNGEYSSNYPSLAVYDSNNMYVAWETTGHYIVVASTSNGGDLPSDWDQELVSDTVPTYYGASIAVSQDNVPSVAWMGGSNGHEVYFSRLSANKWGTPVMVYDQGWLPNLAINSEGKACMTIRALDLDDGVYYTKEQ